MSSRRPMRPSRAAPLPDHPIANPANEEQVGPDILPAAPVGFTHIGTHGRPNCYIGPRGDRYLMLPLDGLVGLDDDLAALEKRLEEGNLKPSDTGLLRMSVAHIHRRLVALLDAAPSA